MGSTDTSQDSIDASSTVMQPELDLFIKDTNPLKLKVNEAVVRHMILNLHLTTSKQLIALKRDN
jgi:hypothetical protein